MSSFKKLVNRSVAGVRHFVHGVGFLIYGILQSKKNRTIICYPRTPWPLYTLWNMAQVCGFKLLKHPSQETNSPTILFQDITIVNPESIPKEALTWINGRCLDIQKSTVAKIFTKAVQRDLQVNPMEYMGYMVEKSEKNPAHDGRIIKGPLQSSEEKAGYVYQRLINNLTKNNEIEDLRTVIVGSKIPLVYRIRRNQNEQFEGYGRCIEVITADEAFSAKEQQELIECAQQIGLDFGEMDVLRDQGDQMIYVVDINKTTVSPPADLCFKNQIAALQKVGEAFEAEF